MVPAPWATRGIAIAGLALLVAALALAPTGFGLSSGAMKSTVSELSSTTAGCTSCHGNNRFAAGGFEVIGLSILGPDGGLVGNRYTPEAVYTINITLDERVAPDGGTTGNHAGFNLRASAGKLAGVAGISQAEADGTQATHLNAASTAWQVQWTAPADDQVISFTLFVNDVDGSGSPNGADAVYRLDFYLTNAAGDVAGAVSEKEVKFGISLQQYWIGLIGLGGMIFVMLAGFVYLKFGSPHNTDKKDR